MMKRQALLFLSSTLLLFLLCNPSYPVRNSDPGENMTIFFDKSVYCPSVNAFWDPNASLVPIRIAAVDASIHSDFITVEIFSSVDERQVTLARTVGDRFEGSAQINCLRYNEMVSNRKVFNARYGDMIFAAYNGHLEASSLLAFPTYVMFQFYQPTYLWKLFDYEGVPIIDYGPPIGVQYNPVEVSFYAIANYRTYMQTQNSTYRERFLVQANWLVKNAVKNGNFSVWEYRFDWPIYNCTAPWASAMAQGGGLSVLTRAYALTGNRTYLHIARTAMRSFEVEMASGGVRLTDSDGVWYEEYADVGATGSKVLNGFIFGLFGLFEYSFATGNKEAFRLFDEGTRTLSLNLYRYDSGSWSYYDLRYRTLAGWNYHWIHVGQLWILYKITGDQTFKEYHDRFNSYF